MTGLLFLLYSLWIGFIVEDQFDFLENNFWLKTSFAVIVGTLFSTWLTFSISLLFGFTSLSFYITLCIMTAFLIWSYLRSGSNNRLIWKKAMQNRHLSITHVLLLLFIMPFFIFGVWEKETGDIVYLGNYTGLSYHLSIVSAFFEQVDFLPENPQSAGAKMSYHFMVNFHSAILHMGGFGLLLSVIIPQILFAFALATMLYYFYKLVTREKTATFFAAFLLIMGHVAFFNMLFAFFGHMPNNMKLDLSSWANVRDFLLYPYYNFLDPVINYFHPQRPFLFAFPLALIILSGIYRMFLKEKADYKTLFRLSLMLGLVPLFHIHTFLVITPILVAATVFLRWDYKRTIPALLPLIPAVLQIFFILSQPKAPGFSGLDVYKLGGGLKEFNLFNSAFLSRLVFWIRTTGFPLILGLAGFVCYFIKNRRISLDSISARRNLILLIFFAVPFMFFLLINFYRFSPNWGDSNKFFLYFEVMLVIFAGMLLGAWYKKGRWGKFIAITFILISAVGPSLLEAYTVFSRKGSHMFSRCERDVAEWIRSNTEKDAIFLTSDDVIHFVPSLAGRRVVDGAYTWNTGFKRPGTEQNVRKIYSTGNERLIKKYHITHILVGWHERRHYNVNENALKKYDKLYARSCKGISYSIYDVRKYQRKKNLAERISCSGERSKGEKAFLSDMSPLEAIQGFRSLHVDRNINKEPIILNGKRYAKGLGVHARSEVIFQLNCKYGYFESYIGLDDTEDNTTGSIVFMVYVDGELKYGSPVMRWDSETQHVKVSLKEAEEIMLVVEDAGDGDTCDHASWADAMVY